MAPFEAWLCLRGLMTLALRMDRHTENAMALADVPGGPREGRAGLVPRARLAPPARRWQLGSSRGAPAGCSRSRSSGGVEGGQRFCDALELAWVATSLGGTHTLVGPRRLDDAPADGSRGAPRGGHRRRARARQRRHRGRRGPRRGHRAGAGARVSRRRVAVLFGGRSAEHEISCISARSVIDALDPDARRGRADRASRRTAAGICCPGRPRCPSETGRMPEIGATRGHRGGACGRGRVARARGGRRHAARRSTWCSRCCTGRWARTAPCRGCSSSRACRTWARGCSVPRWAWTRRCRRCCSRRPGLPVAPWASCASPSGRKTPRASAARAEALGFPVFVKPATLGSSVGISKAHGHGELGAGARRRRSATRARRWWSGVSSRSARSSARCSATTTRWRRWCGEIVPEGHEFYDYEAKYLDADGAQAR